MAPPMDARRRILIQLKLVGAVVAVERGRRIPDSARIDGLVQRSREMLDRMQPDVAGDPELETIYAEVRAAVEANDR